MTLRACRAAGMWGVLDLVKKIPTGLLAWLALLRCDVGRDDVSVCIDDC